MKKTYIQPSIEAVKIQATTILAGSKFNTDDFGGGSGNGDEATTNSFRRGKYDFVEFEEFED